MVDQLTADIFRVGRRNRLVEFGSRHPIYTGCLAARRDRIFIARLVCPSVRPANQDWRPLMIARLNQRRQRPRYLKESMPAYSEAELRPAQHERLPQMALRARHVLDHERLAESR